MDIHICAKTTGIGDHVSAVYAACGVADQGHTVAFHTPHYKWFERVKHPNLTIREFIGPNYCKSSKVNVYQNYVDELVASQRGTCPSRPQWYIDHITKHYALPPTLPSTPSKILGPAMPYHGTPYVLIAPFSAGPTRSWEDDKWQYLAELLVEKGHHIKAVSSAKEEPLLRALLGRKKGVELISGRSPSEVLDLIQNASHIVGNDSSIPHLAALHRKQSIAVCAHIRPEFVFGPGMEYVTPVTPDEDIWSCRFCAWVHDGGFREFCLERCDALQSIEPEQVIQFF